MNARLSLNRLQRKVMLVIIVIIVAVVVTVVTAGVAASPAAPAPMNAQRTQPRPWPRSESVRRKVGVALGVARFANAAFLSVSAPLASPEKMRTDSPRFRIRSRLSACVSSLTAPERCRISSE